MKKAEFDNSMGKASLSRGLNVSSIELLVEKEFITEIKLKMSKVSKAKAKAKLGESLKTK